MYLTVNEKNYANMQQGAVEVFKTVIDDIMLSEHVRITSHRYDMGEVFTLSGVL